MATTATVYPGMIVIATRDIEDEELFVDYRYSSSLNLPDWYLPVIKF